MSSFHFLRPLWLLALPVLALLIARMMRAARGGRGWNQYCDAALLPHIILVGPSIRQTRRPVWLVGLAGLLAILALSGPAWRRLPAPVFRNLSATVILVDLSWAMEATDVRPNRLERARFKIDDFLRARREGQTALVAYAGDAFVVTPLTDDAATIQAQLTALSPRIMPEQGARLDLGLAAAGLLLQQAGQHDGDILVVTAGATDPAAAVEVARLRDQGYRVSILGIGSRDGAPVPLPSGGFLKDEDGRMVVSRLDLRALWQLAQTGGGVYRTLDTGSADTEALLEYLDRRRAAGEREGQSVHVDRWRDEGVWLLPLLLPLAGLAFRRGWLGMLLLTTLIPAPEPAAAIEWSDLWLTPDQRAQRELDAGEAQSAAQRFRNPAWKAAASYRAGAFEDAAKQLASQDDARAHYNRGNALARQDRLEEALKAYEQALRQSPGDEDAEYNRKLVEDVLKQRQDRKPTQNENQGNGQDAGSRGENRQEDSGAPGEQTAPDPVHQRTSDSVDGEANRQAETREQGDQSESPGKQHGSDDQNARSDSRQRPDRPGNSDEHPPENQQADRAVRAGQSTRPGETGKSSPDSVEELAPGDENEQAEAQWLRRIPDDPGGLLKRKFHYQYRLRQQQNHPG